jgi:hypothetical protein
MIGARELLTTATLGRSYCRVSTRAWHRRRLAHRAGRDDLSVARLLCGTARATIIAVRIVIDTSALVAAIRSRRGGSFELPSRAGGAECDLAVSVSLVLEYETVLLSCGAPFLDAPASLLTACVTSGVLSSLA